MPDSQPEVRGGPATFILHWTLFLVWCGLALAGVGLLAGVLLLATHGAGAMDLLLDPEFASDPTFLGLTTIGSIGAMALGAAIGGIFLPTQPGRFFGFDPKPETVSRTLALRSFHPVWLGAAVFATMGIGFLPGWVVDQLMQLEGVRAMAESMRAISDVLADPSRPGWIWLALAVGVSAPVCEELMFRGYLWKAAEHALPPLGVWIATSLLFAAYHMNPLHVLGVLPIGLFFGWLRWMTGSIWPSMLAHFVNNALAISLTLWVGSETQGSLLLSVLAFGLGLVIAAGAWKVAGGKARGAG